MQIPGCNRGFFKTVTGMIDPWLLGTLGVVLLGWFPYCLHLGEIGFGDWSWFYHAFEAIRKTVLDYRQFPFWNPWHTGGCPLFAHPLVGVFSLETLLVLPFGAIIGLNLSVLFYLLIGVLGMWLMLGNLTKNQLTRCWGSALFGLQGTISITVSAGHFVMLSVINLGKPPV